MSTIVSNLVPRVLGGRVGEDPGDDVSYARSSFTTERANSSPVTLDAQLNVTSPVELRGKISPSAKLAGTESSPTRDLRDVSNGLYLDGLSH